MSTINQKVIEQNPDNFNENFVYPEIQPKFITRRYIQYPFIKEFKECDFDFKSKDIDRF